MLLRKLNTKKCLLWGQILVIIFKPEQGFLWGLGCLGFFLPYLFGLGLTLHSEKLNSSPYSFWLYAPLCISKNLVAC